MIRSLAFSVLFAAFATGPAVCQRLPTSVHIVPAADHRSTQAPVQVAPEPGYLSPLLAAAGLGLVGFGAGVLTGYAIDHGNGYAQLYCAAAGGGVGIAVGAHLGNRKRGSLPLDLLTSGVVWGAGFAVLDHYSKYDNQEGLFVTAVLLPPTQLLATVFVERLTGRKRAGRTQVP